MARILLASGDEPQRRGLAGNLTSAGHEVTTVADEAALLSVTQPDEIDCIIADLTLVGAHDFDVITYLVQSYPGAPLVLLTPRDRVDEAARAIRRGAYFYVLSPVNLDDLFYVVDGALRLRARLQRLRDLEQEAIEDQLGESAAMQRVMTLARKVAPTASTVLLLGESGVGKEVVAEMLHRLSPRYDKPFVAVNCSAIPETLLESELFGHVKGAFTGATADRRGLFAEADHGTMFLDEIGDMSVETQAKLLRVLQNREVRRIGENTGQTVDIRVIAATNQDLHHLIGERRFREDLYYRLSVIVLTIPPLRERRDAIPRLIGHFLARYNRQFGKQITDIAPPARFALANYDYPGNVRELENIIEHAAIMADTHELRLSDLPDALHHVPMPAALPAPQAETVAALPAAGGDAISLADVERHHIAAMLVQCGGNQTAAATALGISRSTLWRKMKEYDLRADLDRAADAS